MNVMTEKRVRHLPVLEKGNVIGVLSIGDLVKETITYQQSLIKNLNSKLNIHFLNKKARAYTRAFFIDSDNTTNSALT